MESSTFSGGGRIETRSVKRPFLYFYNMASGIAEIRKKIPRIEDDGSILGQINFLSAI